MDKPSLSSIKIFLTCHFRHQDVAWIPVEQAKHDDVTANEYKSNEDDYDEDERDEDGEEEDDDSNDIDIDLFSMYLTESLNPSPGFGMEKLTRAAFWQNQFELVLQHQFVNLGTHRF